MSRMKQIEARLSRAEDIGPVFYTDEDWRDEIVEDMRHLMTELRAAHALLARFAAVADGIDRFCLDTGRGPAIDIDVYADYEHLLPDDVLPLTVGDMRAARELVRSTHA